MDPHARPVPWVPPVLYAAVLVGGGYHAVLAGRPLLAAGPAGFAAGLLLLAALDLLERRPAAPRAALLAARFLACAGVAALDPSGVSRALFVLVPFSAYFAFGRTVALATAGLCLAALLTGFTLAVPHWWEQPAYVSDLLMSVLGLALALSMAGATVAARRSRARLARYAARVAELSAAEERVRVAREIHDSVGHHLTAAAIQLEKAEAFRPLDPAVADRAVADARRSAGRALEEVRASVSALREARPFSLAAALGELAAADPAVDLDLTGDEDGWDGHALTALHRAAQEAVTNARRHAGADRIGIRIALDRTRARLTVTDNGPGLRAAAPGNGLRGMRERVEALGGTLRLADRPAPGPSGAVVTVVLPAAGAAR
ncbi:sensor histidine kinase [Kitasatospora sp. NPDC048365]|uniref:sensor histidine kinase n=1 Tax=Kitasatospora sp. NPDC048365 TaxID=3364050 RepID=UPI003722CEE5